MKEKYTIEVNEIGVEKITAKFENAGNAATRLSAKAGGLFTGITGKVKGYISALNEATAGANRYAKALLGVKVGGTAPYKAIAAELDVLQAKAIALQSVLTKIPKTAGAFQKATYGPSAITPGVTGFTPMATAKDEQIARNILGTQAETAKVAEDQVKSEKTLGGYLEQVKAANYEINRTKKIRSGIVQSQLKYEKQLEELQGRQGQMDFEQYRQEEARLKQIISKHDRERRFWTSKVDAAKKYAMTIQPIQAGEMHISDYAIKNAQQSIKANNKAAASKRGETIENENFNKSLDKTAKRSNFLNSNFAKFSIIMSGIAATLFVWQTVSRIIASVVRIGTDMEVAYAKVAHTLKLSADEMARLNTEARKQQSLGGPPVKEYVALVAEFEKWGMAHETAISYVNAALEKEREILKGTVTAELREFKGLWVEIASQSFEASKQGFISLLEGVNAQLANITDAKGGLDKFLAAINALDAASKKFSLTEEIKELKEVTTDTDLSGIIYGWVKAVSTAAMGMRFGMKSKPTKTDFPVPSGPVDPKATENAAAMEQIKILAEDIEGTYSTIKTDAGEIDTRFWKVVESQEEIQNQAKNMQRDMKIASDILGNMNAKQLEEQLDVILYTMANIQKAGRSGKEQMQVWNALEAQRRQINTQPMVNAYKKFYDSVGIMSDEYYEEQKKRIEENFNIARMALGTSDPTGKKAALMQAAKNEALFKLDEQYYSKAMTAGQQFYDLFGYMTEDYINRKLARINNLYVNESGTLGDHHAKMLAEERKYILEQQSLITPMAFYKKYYDEFGIMSDKYYDNEIKKINHEYEANKKVDKQYADRVKARQMFVLETKKTFSKEFEAMGGITPEGVQNMEELAEATGYASQKLQDYWDLESQWVEKRVKGVTGDPMAAEIAGLQDRYEKEVKVKKSLVDVWDDYYQQTGIMSEGYYKYKIWQIEEIEKIQAKATNNDVAVHEAATEKKKRIDREYALSKMGGGFYQAAEQFDIQAPAAYYEKLKEMAAEQANDYIKAGADRLKVEEWLHKQLLVLREKELSKSKESIDGFELLAVRVELATKTAAERTAETLQNIVEGTKDVWSDFIFTAMDDYSNLWDLFEDTISNWKRMIDRMVADWIAAGIAKMMFGDLSSGTGLLGGTGSSGGYGMLGAIGGMISGILGGMGGTPTGMTGQSINAALMLVKAAGGIFDRQGEVQKFATGAVFDKTTPFAYAGGTGVLGEAGPEAIVPLKRGPDGRLGIAEFGRKGDRITISPTIIVQAPEGRIPRDSMNQITSRMGRTIMGSLNRNS